MIYNRSLQFDSQLSLVNMKSLIKSMIKESSDDSLKLKKLKKAVLSKIKESPADYKVSGDADSAFDGAIDGLVETGKYEVEDGVIRVAKSSKKRKESKEVVEEDSIEAEEETPAEPPMKVHKTVKKSKHFDDLWAKGEQFYRDGILDSEYIQTNPDQ
jgi:hypothetical protein